MSHYQTRWCERHGDWDDDVDSPAEACPECIKAGLFKTRAQLERELAEAKREATLAYRAAYDLRAQAQRPSLGAPKPQSSYVPLSEEEIEVFRDQECAGMHPSDDFEGPRLHTVNTVCDMAVNSLLFSKEIDRLRSLPVSPLAAPCQHEPYQGRCVHCNAPFVDGKAVVSHTEPPGEVAELIERLRQVRKSNPFAGHAPLCEYAADVLARMSATATTGKPVSDSAWDRPPSLLCPRCGADRYKESCRETMTTCPMKGDASGPQ